MTTNAPHPPIARHPRIYDDVLELITDTPLVEVRRLEADEPRASVLGKLESQNPGGSVKDRICLSMILEAEARGALQPGGVVVEPTSGNTGIGLAMVAAARGYRLRLVMPETMSIERRKLVKAFGAEPFRRWASCWASSRCTCGYQTMITHSAKRESASRTAAMTLA